MNWANQGEYNAQVKEAVGASSAMPMFFDPLRFINGFGIEEQLVDGGVICVNPALYAFLMANQLYGHQKVRVVSMGTGSSIKEDQEQQTPINFSKYDNWGYLGDFMMSIDSKAATYYLNETLGDDHLRVQTFSTAKLDSYQESDKNLMVVDGKKMYENNKDKIEAILRKIVDQKIGGKNV